MTDAIITTGAALVASGSWFADKIFGPSVAALGDNLKIHLHTRAPQIFGRAEQIAKAEELHLSPVSPGLLSRMIMNASFSEDSADITDWWANLFVEAATNHTEPNMQAVFSDIMAMIGPKEARVLTDFVAYYRSQIANHTLASLENIDAMDGIVQESTLFKLPHSFPLTNETVDDVHEHLANPKIPLPVRTFAWKLPLSFGEALSWRLTTLPWYVENRVPIEILERSRVLKFIRLEIPIMADQAAWVDLVGLTALGRACFESCSRENLAGNRPSIEIDGK